MASFETNEAKVTNLKTTDDGKEAFTQPAHPLQDAIHSTWSKPGDQRVASQNVNASDIFAGKTEKQYVEQAFHETRKRLGLPDNAKSEDVFKKMGENGYKNFLKANHHAQEEALTALGLTRENISPESITKSMIEHRRIEEKLPLDASLNDIEVIMYKKFYRDVKKGTATVDYD